MILSSASQNLSFLLCWGSPQPDHEKDRKSNSRSPHLPRSLGAANQTPSIGDHLTCEMPLENLVLLLFYTSSELPSQSSILFSGHSPNFSVSQRVAQRPPVSESSLGFPSMTSRIQLRPSQAESRVMRPVTVGKLFPGDRA